MHPAPANTWRARAGRLAAAAILGGATAFALAAPAAAAEPPAYTALGDSFASGLGTRTYYNDGTSCRRSPYAYPVLDAGRLGAALTFAACSGARVSTVLNSQLGSLSAATRYVSVMVGGNDAGFANVISRCALPWPYTCWAEINNARAYITNTLPGSLNTLYSQIRARAPSARVVVVGYPRLFNGEQCNALARISPGEQAELNRVADLLASVIGGRAGAHAFGFVDPRSAFTGHAVCDDVEWVNGLSNPVEESYHPNRGGHVGYANLVEPSLRAATSARSRADAA